MATQKTYEISSTHTLGWHQVNCTTERAAKRQATNRFGNGPPEDTLQVAERVKGKNPSLRIVASKSNTPGSNWRSLK